MRARHRRKPTWLRQLEGTGIRHRINSAMKCPVCGEWILLDSDGEERRWDPYPLEGDDIVVAVLLGRKLCTPVSLPVLPSTTLVLATGPLNPDRLYFAEHECWRAPVTQVARFREVKRVPQDVRFLTGINLTDEDVRQFEQIWRGDFHELV